MHIFDNVLIFAQKRKRYPKIMYWSKLDKKIMIKFDQISMKPDRAGSNINIFVLYDAHSNHMHSAVNQLLVFAGF